MASGIYWRPRPFGSSTNRAFYVKKWRLRHKWRRFLIDGWDVYQKFFVVQSSLNPYDSRLLKNPSDYTEEGNLARIKGIEKYWDNWRLNKQ